MKLSRTPSILPGSNKPQPPKSDVETIFKPGKKLEKPHQVRDHEERKR